MRSKLKNFLMCANFLAFVVLVAIIYESHGELWVDINSGPLDPTKIDMKAKRWSNF